MGIFVPNILPLKKSHQAKSIKELLRSIEEVKSLCSKHESEIVKLKEENNTLKKENSSLKKQLSLVSHRKNSINSSMPPSNDIAKPKRTVSLRKPSGKRPGGQPGRKGTTLEMRAKTDIVENHYPQVCANCGNNLSEIPGQFSGRRQVIDLPVIRTIVTEHRIFSKQCSCGHCTKSEYPKAVKTPVGYGPNIQSLVAYLSARQYIPVDRMREFLSEILNVNLSDGGICYLLDKMAGKAEGELQKIKTQVMASPVIGADETGANINGDNHWFWTFQNNRNTYIGVHKNRGFNAIDDLFGNKFENSTLITDCWSSYFKTNAEGHQICTAHLQRELIGLTEQYPMQTWTMKFNDLLHSALKLNKETVNISNDKIKQIHRQLNKLLAINLNPKWEKVIKFRNRMVKYKDFLFNYLTDPSIPPDNNASERAIRNVKVKQKVSGFFKSFKGAQNYATLRSCIDTAIKQEINPWTKLLEIATLR